MSAAKVLQQQARQIESDLSTPGLPAETVAELTEQLAEIANALQKDGETISPTFVDVYGRIINPRTKQNPGGASSDVAGYMRNGY